MQGMRLHFTLVLFTQVADHSAYVYVLEKLLPATQVWTNLAQLIKSCMYLPVVVLLYTHKDTLNREYTKSVSNRLATL